MKWLLLSILLPVISARIIANNDVANFLPNTIDDTVTLSMLDEIEQYMTGMKTFDRRFYRNIKKCIEKSDSGTFHSQSLIWRKLIAVWESRGLPNDVWGSFNLGYLENNVTKGMFSGMEFVEPCNSASNIAYYRTLLEICNERNHKKWTCLSSKVLNSLIKATGFLVPSSYFHHVSRTRLGLLLDRRIIDILILQRNSDKTATLTLLFCQWLM